ncbi:hypothetical protein PWT90_06450 [Aphanocladium album]|nr:hypothetical protein PWT90_06450 [Aphanocladium album]
MANCHSTQHLEALHQSCPSFSKTEKELFFRHLYRLEPSLFKSIAQESTTDTRTANLGNNHVQTTGSPSDLSSVALENGAASPQPATQSFVSQTPSTIATSLPSGQSLTTIGPSTDSTHDTSSTHIADHTTPNCNSFRKIPRCIKKEFPKDLLDSLAEHTEKVYVLCAQQAVNFDPVADMKHNDIAVWLTAIRRRFHAISIYRLVEDRKELYTSKESSKALSDVISKAQLNGTKNLDSEEFAKDMKTMYKFGKVYNGIGQNVSWSAVLLILPKRDAYLEERKHTKALELEFFYSKLRKELKEAAGPEILARAEELASKARDWLYAGWCKRANDKPPKPPAILPSNAHQNKRKRVDNHYEAETGTSRADPSALVWGTQTEPSGVPPEHCALSTVGQTPVDERLYAASAVSFPAGNTGNFVDFCGTPNVPFIRKTQSSEPVFGWNADFDSLIGQPLVGPPVTIAWIAKTQQHHELPSNFRPDDFPLGAYSEPYLASPDLETSVDGSMAPLSAMGAIMAVQTPA